MQGLLEGPASAHEALKRVRASPLACKSPTPASRHGTVMVRGWAGLQVCAFTTDRVCGVWLGSERGWPSGHRRQPRHPDPQGKHTHAAHSVPARVTAAACSAVQAWAHCTDEAACMHACRMACRLTWHALPCRRGIDRSRCCARCAAAAVAVCVSTAMVAVTVGRWEVLKQA